MTSALIDLGAVLVMNDLRPRILGSNPLIYAETDQHARQFALVNAAGFSAENNEVMISDGMDVQKEFFGACVLCSTVVVTSR